ncbi:MFS transporter [Cnuibacter sp. UC19_7]|uniref:MFS transporter n=1 Tax=Cnuibacter sp. UC19_7 TaxID=3350166 RepID=UPI0036716E43
MMTTGSRQGNRALALVAMTFANAMVLVDQTAVPLILPSVMSDLHVGSQMVQWVLTGSLLPLAGLLVFGGRLGDLLGHRRVFVLGTLVFAGASACAGFAPTFEVLIAFRVLQGAGGALMLPTTVAVIGSVYPGAERGRALGVMGGIAAIAGALGPAIGGGLTTTLGWRSVLLINVPLAALAVIAALVAVRPDQRRTARAHVDLRGTLLLCVALVGIVFGLSQSQSWGWASPGVLVPLAVAAVSGVVFVLWERRSPNPLLDFSLLRKYPNYAGATLSQGFAGMAEMGLGVLFPLLLVLNLGMDPGLAGLALIPSTLPMILIAPLAGRWYDRSGGRMPLTVGFLVLALAGIALAIGVHSRDYWLLFPGFLIYGIGLALVLTVNDPVSLDTVPEKDHGQASGVSATAEQFGGAFGIAVLYLVFHTVYVTRLESSLGGALSADQELQLKDDIVAAESTGLDPSRFDPAFTQYLGFTLDSSIWGMSVAFLTVTVLAGIALVLTRRFVRPGPPPADSDA